jgi:hypothetical protein
MPISSFFFTSITATPALLFSFEQQSLQDTQYALKGEDDPEASRSN